jgi:hypothetical protein
MIQRELGEGHVHNYQRRRRRDQIVVGEALVIEPTGI